MQRRSTQSSSSSSNNNNSHRQRLNRSRLRQSVAFSSIAVESITEDWEDVSVSDVDEETSKMNLLESGVTHAIPEEFAEEVEEEEKEEVEPQQQDQTKRRKMRRVSTERLSQEWETVDTLFKYLDVDNTGTLSTDDLVNGLKVIGDRKFGRLIVDAAGEDTDNLDREKLYSLLFSRRERTKFQHFTLFILTWVLPLFYSVSTRLPFISVSLEVVEEKGGSLTQAGIVLGAYQTCRAIANAMISYFGGESPITRLQLPLVLCGLAGWVFLSVNVEFSIAEGVWPLLALCGVGLGEVIVNLQTALITETQFESPAHVADSGVLASRLRSQYAAVSAGSFVAYILGGNLYTQYGFQAVAVTGVGCQVAQLMGTFVFFCGHQDWEEDTQRLGYSGRQLLRSIGYRIQAMHVIERETHRTSMHLGVEEPGLVDAYRDARKDAILTESLKKLHRAFFDNPSVLPRPVEIRKEENGLGRAPSMPRQRHRQSIIASAPLNKMLTQFQSLNKSAQTSRRGGLNDLDFAKVALLIMDTDRDGYVSEREFVAYLAPRVFLSLFGSARLTAVRVVWPYMKVVVLTQAVMALCIGTFLSTALLLYTEKFGVDTGTVGLLLGIGEGLGALVIFVLGVFNKRLSNFEVDPEGKDAGFFTVLLSRPLHVPIVLIVLGVSCMGFAADEYAVAIVFQMIMSSINDLSVTFLNELIATSIPANKFSKYQGIGQWLRRLGNMLTGFLGPVLFGVFFELPFLLFGSIVTAWAFFLWYLLYRHMEAMTKTKKDGEPRRPDLLAPINSFRPVTYTPWHILEREYYSANKEDIDEKFLPHDVKYDLAVMDHRFRRMAAALRAETSKREDLERSLQQLLAANSMTKATTRRRR